MKILLFNPQNNVWSTVILMLILVNELHDLDDNRDYITGLNSEFSILLD